MTQRWKLLALLLALPACADEGGARDTTEEREDNATANPYAVPEDFERVHTQCGFDFYAPPDIASVPVTPIDSCVVQYALGDCTMLASAGAYSSPGAGSKPEYQRERVSIDGRPATFVRYRQGQTEAAEYRANLHVPISDKDGWYISIDVNVSCPTSEARDHARDVLLSVDLDDSW